MIEVDDDIFIIPKGMTLKQFILNHIAEGDTEVFLK